MGGVGEVAVHHDEKHSILLERIIGRAVRSPAPGGGREPGGRGDVGGIIGDGRGNEKSALYAWRGGDDDPDLQGLKHCPPAPLVLY